MSRTTCWTSLVLVAGSLFWVQAVVCAQPAGETATGKPATGDPVPAAAGASADEAAAEGPAKASDDLAQQEDRKENWLLQIFGPGMWPLWACSIALVALILERRKALKPHKIIDPAMIDRVADLVGELKLDDAQKLAADSPTVVGRAWGQALHEFSLGGTNLVETMTNSTVLAFKPLKRHLLALATLGVVSPLLGLLGTVLGMIIVFHQIAATGGADKAKLAGGIGLALFTTAGGLIVAIPAILSNRYFTSRLTSIAEQAEEGISRINYRYSHAVAVGQKTAATAAAAAPETK